jgi:hypothetical protein
MKDTIDITSSAGTRQLVDGGIRRFVRLVRFAPITC